jgi:S-adenosyl-L-methionine hydrolase (adenosine-forming)
MGSVVTFLSDYGLEDEFVGVVHAVIARVAPDARVIDLTHGIARHDVRAGALALRRALPFAPPGVHLAVVDPEVGGRRRGVAVRCAGEERVLVGPDNGLLMPAAERFGGVAEAIDLERSPWRLEPVSATFHGRDVFAPVAGRLAAGAELGDGGEPLDPAALVRLDLPTPRVEGGVLVAHVLGFDHFGNALLDAAHPELSGTGLKLGRPVSVNGRRATYVSTFADVPSGELLVYEDASRTLALAVNRGSARDELSLHADDDVRVAPA